MTEEQFFILREISNNSRIFRSNLFASPKGTLKSLLKGSKSDRAARTLVVAESNISSATLIESGGGEEFSNEVNFLRFRIVFRVTNLYFSLSLSMLGILRAVRWV